MGFEYTHNSINNIAEKCHEMMGLSAPITLDELKTAIQNMGIILTAKSDMSCYDDNVIRHGAEDYEIYYNPKQSEQTQLWNLANAFGKIILFGLPQDVDRDIYSGEFTLLSEQGDILDIHEIFQDIDILKSELKRCTDLDDVKHRVKNFIKATSDEYRLVNVYDFHKESMLRIRKECINPAYNRIYYMKIIKN